jgi:predicted acyltransferase
MAIPLALGGRLRRGESRGAVLRHVLGRTFALLVMGVFMVNGDAAGPGLLPAPAWNMLMVVALLLAWAAPGRGSPSARLRLLRIVGVALLVALAFVYRGEHAAGWFQMRTSWWGILGLIGWSYLVGAGLYLAFGERPAVLTGFIALLYCLFLADFAGHASWARALAPVLSVGSMVGAHGAIVVSGVVLGLLVVGHRRDGGTPLGLARSAWGYAVGLVVAGLLLHSLHDLHPAFQFSKILATPPWCLVSSGATAAVWALIYVAVDVRGFRRWPGVVSIAGENALLAYLLPVFLLSLFDLSASVSGGFNPYEALGGSVVTGTLRSIAFTWAVVALAGTLRRRGVRVQL